MKLLITICNILDTSTVQKYRINENLNNEYIANVIITSHRISIILFSDITETWNVISMNYRQQNCM